MEKETKVYVGSGKKSEKYDIVNISVCLSDLPKEHIFEYKGKKYIKLTVAAKKETDQYGKTHSVCIDTFKPEKTEAQKTPEVKTPISQTEVQEPEQDSLPF